MWRRRVKKLSGEREGESKHYYRTGLCSKPFVPAVFGPGTIGGFCPRSNGYPGTNRDKRLLSPRWPG